MSKFLGLVSRVRAAFIKSGKKSLRPCAARLAVEQFEPRTLLSGMPPMSSDMMAVMNLVPDAAVTDTAVQNGAWSSPSTWKSGHLPGNNANVLIPTGLSVTVDGVETARLHTLRVDGTLQFATAQNTGLLVDTIVVMAMGTLDIGTTASPIAAGNTATVTFTDSAPINTMWDPLLISRGLISMGTVSMVGQTVTPYASLASAPLPGTTQLNLSQAPTNWKVGDQLVLPGTDPSINQDENLTILGISGTQVTVSPLAHDHSAPSAGLAVYVADLTRNVVLQSENPADTAGRGHVMFMTSTVNVAYVGFDNLGRTNKLIPINDPQLDMNGMLMAGTGTNPRGRYAVHFHHTGTDATMPPATVTGCAVVGSPGWGYVNHDSYVVFTNNVADKVTGAAFVTESGSEIGSFIGNLAIRDTGSNEAMDNRKAVQDFGFNGTGFWFQGPGVTVQNNIAIGQSGPGFTYYSLGLVAADGTTTVFSAANLQNPALANGQPTIPVDQVPIRLFAGNVTYGSEDGVLIENNLKPLTSNPGAQSVIDNYTAWNIRQTGAYVNYSNGTVIQNSWLIGTLNNPSASDTGIKTATEPQYAESFVNNRVEGWNYGYDLWPWGTQTIQGGFLNNVRDIEMHLDSTRPQGQNITISSTTFGTLSVAQLAGLIQYHIFLDGSFAGLTSTNLPYVFAPQSITVNAGPYVGQIYFNEQAAGYVPFPAGLVPNWVPSQFVGLTNQQLWNQYGWAVGGAAAPAGASSSPGLNGLIGPATTLTPAVTLVSNQVSNQLLGYQLIYQDASGKRVVDPTLVNLSPGWNLITRTVNGVKTTFFVHGGAITDTSTFNGGGAGQPGSGSGPGTTPPGTPLSANEAFVQALYNDFLHRNGSLAELDGWVAALLRVGRSGVAAGIIRSGEALSGVIAQVYLTYLNRAPDAGGQAAWLAFLQNGGTEEQFIGGVLSSGEYAARVAGTSGSPDASFIQSLYNQLLGRTGSSSEIGLWLNALPAVGRAGIAAGFLGSGEFRGYNIAGFYTGLLHRTPSAAEVAGWVNTGADLLTIEVAFASSGEFYSDGLR